MLRKPVALLIACAFVFALAACGGDDSGSATATTGSSGSGAPAATDGGSSGSSGSSAGTTAVPDFSGASGGEKFCSQAKGFEDTLGSSDFGQSSDPAQLKKDFGNAQDALKQLESSAPDEIKDDVKTVSAAFTSLVAVLESVNYDTTKLTSDPTALAKLQNFDSKEVTDASARVEAYLSQVCGISSADTTGG